jgi:excisionase family DNA binding protein
MRAKEAPMQASEKLYTTGEVAEFLQADATSVVKWVNDGLLVSYRTPGGHRRIRSSDLVAFMRAHGMWIPPDLRGARVKLLLVDDDPRVLGAMKRAMTAHEGGVEFLTAGSGMEALVMVGSERPDVLVLDIAMPDVDGLEVLRRLKERPETAKVDVVILSGNLTPALRRKALALGARAACDKPISAAELVRLATKTAAAESERSQAV